MGLALGVTSLRSEDKNETAPMNESNKKQVAVIKTSEGEMVAEFWSDVAPSTVENFKKLAKSGFYDGTAFHRIVKGFMIQGGDPLTKDLKNEARYGTGDPGYKVKAEFNKKSHERGVLSMARSSDPDSAGRTAPAQYHSSALPEVQDNFHDRRVGLNRETEVHGVLLQFTPQEIFDKKWKVGALGGRSKNS